MPTPEVGRSAPDPRPTPERTTVASVPALGPVGPAAAASSPLEGARRRLGDLLDTDGGRIGATAVVVLLIVLAIAGSLAFTGEGGEPDDAVAADDAPDPTVRVTSTTTSTTSTTTSTTTTSTTTTTAPPTTTTEPPPPPTTAAPAPPPPPPTTEPPPAPDIESFWGNYWGREGSGNCRRYERPLTLWWNADDATRARIRPEGGDWQEVSIGLGSHSTCSDYGTTWVLEVSNDAGVTDTATWR